MNIFLTSIDNPKENPVGGKHVHLLLLEKGLTILQQNIVSFYPSSKLGQGKLGQGKLGQGKLGQGGEKVVNKFIFWLKKSILYYFILRIRNFQKVILIRNTFLKLQKQMDFDIIHAHDVVSILAFKNISIPKILTLHGYYTNELISDLIPNRSLTIILRPYCYKLEKDAVKIADKIITVDNRIKDYLIDKFKIPRNKISVVFNAVDTNKFYPVTKEKQIALKQENGFSSEDFIVLVPRRLVRKNGVIYAVRAMKFIKNDNIKMIIIGDGPELENIKKESGRDNRIRLLGVIPNNDIDLFYKLSDVIIIPSITSNGVQEATSLSMLEGMASGKIVVCSNIGGLKEVLENKNIGILVPEKKADKIAKTIVEIYESPAQFKKIIIQARNYVIQNHSFISHAQKILNLYKNV